MHSEKKEKNDSIFFNFAIILTQLINYLYLLVKKAQNDNETRGRSPLGRTPLKPGVKTPIYKNPIHAGF